MQSNLSTGNFITQFTQWNQNSYTYLKDTQVCHFGIFFW